MLNQIIIMGRLTRDPELRRTGSGLAVTSFGVAVERDFPNKDTGEREVDYINCVAWREKGEFVSKWFTKGSMIVVVGRLQMRNYTDKDDNKRVAAEVIVDSVYFGENKKDRDAREGKAGNNFSNTYPTLYSAPSYGAYIPPVQPGSDFAMRDDDDAQLPF